MNFAKGTSSSGAESHQSWSHAPSQLCVYTCKKITYVKDPAVHGRVWWIMETPKQPSMRYNVRVFIMMKLDSIQKKKNFNITDPSDLAWAVASSTKWRQCYITVTSSMLALRLMQKVVSVSCSISSVNLSILIQILNSPCWYWPSQSLVMVSSLSTSLSAGPSLLIPASSVIEAEGLIFWHVKDSGWLLLILTSSDKTAQIGWVPADCERQFWAQWFSVSRGWWIKEFFSSEHISNLLSLFMWTGSGNGAETGRICTDCEDSSGHEDSIWAEIGKPKDWFSLAYIIVLLFDFILFLHWLLSHLPHPPPHPPPNPSFPNLSLFQWYILYAFKFHVILPLYPPSVCLSVSLAFPLSLIIIFFFLSPKSGPQ